MHPARVRVTPKALHRCVTGQRGGAGRLEQPVDRGDRAAGGAHLVATRPSAQVERNLFAGGQQRVLVADIADQLAPRGVDVTGRLGDAHFGERVVLGLLPRERRAHPLALVLHMRVIRAVRHADDRCRDGGGMHCAPRHLVDRCGVVLVAAGGAVVHRLVGQEPVPGHEDILDHQRVAAGAFQTDHKPGVIDPVLGARDQEAAEVHRPAVLDDRATHERPGGMVTTRRPVPGAVDQVATVDDDAGAHRGIRRRDARLAVLAPDLLLSLLVEQRQMPVVHPDDRAHPTGRTARARQAPRRLVEQCGVALQTAPLLGLQQGEETDLVERLDGLVRNPLGQRPTLLPSQLEHVTENRISTATSRRNTLLDTNRNVF